MTKREKQKAGEDIIKEMLEDKSYTATELIEKAAQTYTERHGDKTDNPNDVRGRIGSILDTMKKNEESGVQFDGGVYALKKAEEVKPVKAKRTKKTEKKAESDAPVAEKTVKKTRKKKTDTPTEEAKEKATPLPVPPLQPIVPVDPVTPEVAPDAAKPKKRTRKAKAKAEAEASAEAVVKEPVKETAPENTFEKTLEAVEEKTEIRKEEKKEKIDASPKGTVMDMSFLFGEVKPATKREDKPRTTYEPVKVELETEEKAEIKVEQPKTEQKPAPKQEKTVEKTQKTVQEKKPVNTAKPVKPVNVARPVKTVGSNRRAMTADEKLQDAFLTRLHRLGGEYFEYYSVYLLERYSRRNGRRLEALRISGGDHDGGIDGEIELTDRLGFRETIYIQAKNWDPDKGDEKQWTVGETLLQQFIGACVCRQAKQGRQSCRGIFITTSRFTPDAKRMLEETDDKFVGYDGTDLYETAKECEFGIIKKNGEWVLDEALLSGMRAFYTMS